MSNLTKYDAFICCSEADLRLVTTIAEHLDNPALNNKQKFEIWFEPWKAIPGRSVLGSLGEGIHISKTFLFFIGSEVRSGLRNAKLNIALQAAIENPELTIIGVQLPGSPDQDGVEKRLKTEEGLGLQLFLKTSYWADLRHLLGRDGKLDWEALWTLECGIAGNAPGRGRPNTLKEEEVKEAVSIMLREKPLIDENAYLLCNRRRQFQKLNKFINLTLEERESKTETPDIPKSNPAFFFIPGHEDELHYELVNRFITYEIRPPGSEKEFIAPNPIDLSFSCDGELEEIQEDFRMTLETSLGIYEEIESAQQLIELPDLNGPEVIVFTHDLFVEEWSDDSIEFLNWYIGEFWKVEINEAHPQFVIFINLHYPLEENESNAVRLNGIIEELDKLDDRFSSSCALLKELKQISASDVRLWVAKNNLKPYADDLLEKIFKNHETGEFYKRRHFKHVKQFLLHFLDEVRIQVQGNT